MSDKNRRSLLDNVQEGHNMFGARTEKETRAERRPLLKGLAVSVGSALGLSGTTAAKSSEQSVGTQEKVQTAMDGYKSRSGVKAALRKHGDSLLADVAENGYLESTDLQIHNVEPHSAPSSEDPDEGTYVNAFEKDGEFTAHISIVRKTPSATVRFNIQPQAENAFATIKSRGGELITVVNPSVDDDVSTQEFCTTDYTCPPSSCCTFCSTEQTKHEETCCTYSDGSTSCTEEPIDQCCVPSVCC